MPKNTTRTETEYHCFKDRFDANQQLPPPNIYDLTIAASCMPPTTWKDLQAPPSEHNHDVLTPFQLPCGLSTHGLRNTCLLIASIDKKTAWDWSLADRAPSASYEGKTTRNREVAKDQPGLVQMSPPARFLGPPTGSHLLEK